MMIVKPGSPSGEGREGGPEGGGPDGYPETEERHQRIAEETLLHLLYEERFREACMAARNLDSRSRDYLDRLTPTLEGPQDPREIQQRVLDHANRSQQFQDGMILFARRRATFFIEGSRQRSLLSEIASVLMTCRHRNDLARRLLLSAMGRAMNPLAGRPRFGA